MSVLNPYLSSSCCIYPFLLSTYSSYNFFPIPIPHTLNSPSKMDLKKFLMGDVYLKKIFKKKKTFFIKNIYLYIYLAMPSLGCGMWQPVPWSGTETRFPALGVRNLSPWTNREVPYLDSGFSGPWAQKLSKLFWTLLVRDCSLIAMLRTMIINLIKTTKNTKMSQSSSLDINWGLTQLTVIKNRIVRKRQTERYPGNKTS